MKFLPGTLAALFATRDMRLNIVSFLKYLALLGALIVLYSFVFHLIMGYEDQSHSWPTGLYWVLIVMTTLGFGDVVFTSDLGRLFTVLVLVSGVILLLVMLPFQFIRLFYAPWLEARMRSRAPRSIPGNTRGHVIIASNDAIVPGLIRRLRAESDPYVLLEEDPEEAVRLIDQGMSVVTGPLDSVETYRAVRADRADLLVANISDTVNTNVTLTVRQLSESVPIAAIVEADDSIDVLELSGATYVLPLKRQLGEYLANRIHTIRGAHVVGTFHELQIAELPVADTEFAGLHVSDTHLRGHSGVNIVGLWSSGRLHQAQPETVIGESDVLVVAGLTEALEGLNREIPQGRREERPVLVLGAGRVGLAAAEFLHRQGIRTHVIDRDEGRREAIAEFADEVIIGDAADRSVLERAGLEEASSVVLTTNDDAINIYLAVYCRRLNPKLRIVSRITAEQNIEAIHRAGADFALSYASLGAESVFSHLKGHETVTVGEGVDLFTRPVPQSYRGKTLEESGIGTRTGLCVVALRTENELISQLHMGTILHPDGELVLMGTVEQRRTFTEEFGAPAAKPRFGPRLHPRRHTNQIG